MNDAAEHAKHVAWHLSLGPALHVEAKNLGIIDTCLGDPMQHILTFDTLSSCLPA